MLSSQINLVYIEHNTYAVSDSSASLSKNIHIKEEEEDEEGEEEKIKHMSKTVIIK